MPAVSKPTMRRGEAAHALRAEMGEIVRTRREGLGLTQRQLAGLVGVGESAVSAIELGRVSMPPERYLAFADALGFEPAVFALLAIRYSNPWAFALISGTDPRAAVAEVDARFPSRAGRRMNQKAADRPASETASRCDA